MSPLSGGPEAEGVEGAARQLRLLAGGGSPCRTGARCTPLRSCPLLANLMDHSCIASNRARDIVCGYAAAQPLVCCPAGGGGAAWAGRPGLPPPAPSDAFSGGCGRRLVAGAEEGLGAQPWAVRVAFAHVRSNKFTYPCCGSIVTQRTILTAAHCALAKAEYYKLSSVMVGEYDTRSDPDCTRDYCAHHAQVIPISHVIVHPEYQKDIYKHDIALLVLKSPVNYSLTAQPVCISDAIQYDVQRMETRVRLVGWGKLAGQEVAPPRQQQLELPLLPLGRCAALYKDAVPITGRQLCAGGEAGRDACKGFGGAPLLLRADDGRHVQIGLTSFGSEKCGAENVPSVYTNIAKYTDWIKSNLVE